MKKIAAILLCLVVVQLSKAQERVITTGVPFLLVAGDARSAGMADNGVATSTDAYSQQWNPAKYSSVNQVNVINENRIPYLNAIFILLWFGIMKIQLYNDSRNLMSDSR